MILATAEISITIVAASIPVLRVFIRNTMHSQSSRDNNQHTLLASKISDFELLTPPSLVRMDTSKESDFSFQLNEQSGIPKRKRRQKSTENGWLSSASQSGLDLKGHEA